jgi:peptide/nickel transport system ATP-binding protein
MYRYRRDRPSAFVHRPLRRFAGPHRSGAEGARADSVSLSRDLLERYPHQPSGGLKARVGIARGLASQPSLLILDEPTAALDISVQAAILKLLHRLRQDLGLSYLLISDDIEVVRLMCERIIILRDGQVVETEWTADVLAAPRSVYGRTLIAAVPRLKSSAINAADARQT